MSAPFRLPYRTAPDTLEAIRAELDHMLGRVDAFAAEPHRPDEAEAAEVLAREGRALYLRRALEEAADVGAAMLDALGEPQLDALDAAIVALDALDADPDFEPSLGYYTPGFPMDREAEPEHDEDGGDREAVNEDGDTLDDGEHDTADLEWSCGWTAKVDQVHLGHAQDEHEDTAPERHGRGFIRSGPEDAEDDELGDDHAGDPVAWVFGPSRREADRCITR